MARPDVLGRFMSKVSVVDGACWEWIGAKNQRGYGIFWLNGRNQSAHRVVLHLLRDGVPDALQVDHLCKNTSCVNPDHLEPVTGRENIRRSDAPAGKNSRKTHCPRGHELAGANLYICPRGRRECRNCRIEAARRHNKRKAAAHG